MNPPPSAPASARKVALVTGASAGIGKAIVRQLLKDGYTVYGAARRVAAMQDIASEGAKILALDVTDEASLQACVKTILDTEGRIDALINNAGYGEYGALEDVPIAAARKQFEVNVFGLMRLTQLVLPSMRAARAGRIVNISSMGGKFWMPIGGWYHATKHALEVLSNALRMELQPFGIQVVIIEPGAIQSEWSGIAADTLEAHSKDTVYAGQCMPFARLLRNYKNAAPPTCVARAVSNSLRARRPWRRYRTPFDAKLLVFIHAITPEWLWELLLRIALR